MKEYCIMRYGQEYFFAEGLAEKGVIFDPGKRVRLKDESALVHNVTDTVKKGKKVKINISEDSPQTLDQILQNTFPKAILNRTEYKRGEPPKAIPTEGINFPESK